MNRSFGRFGALGLAVVLMACSASEEPPTFAEGGSLEARLEARYGTKFAVERGEGRAFWLSPLGQSRNVATSEDAAEAEALAVVHDFSADLGSAAAPTLRTIRKERDEAGGVAVRFVQLVPGTAIEIEEHGGAFDVAADGTLVSIAASLTDASAFPTSLRVSPDEADRAIRAIFGGRTLVHAEPMRPVARKLENGARVEYLARVLVDDEGYEVRVDASDVARVDVARASLGIDGTDETVHAFAFRAYPMTPILKAAPEAAQSFGYAIATTLVGADHYLVQQPTKSRSKIATVEKTGGGSVNDPAKWAFISSRDATEFLGQFPVTKTVGELALPTPYAVDTHHHAALVDDAFRRIVKQSPSKDGVMVSMIHANDAVVLERIDDGYDRFHWEQRHDPSATRFAPSYDPIANRIQFGDGGYFDHVKQFVLPTGIAIDIAGHEWTHAYMSNKTKASFSGIDGALQEVVGDAVGKIIALRNGDTDENTFGGRIFATRFAVRSFADPAAYKAPVAERRGPERRVAKGSLPMPKHVSGMAIECMKDTLVDQGCVHFNAGPGNHAFYLMKEALKAAKQPWRDRLEALWFYSAGHAVVARSPLPASKYESLALQQVDFARSWGRPSQLAIACAWSRVGALSDPELASRGLACPAAPAATATERAAPPPPSDCGGKADGYYCNTTTPYSATYCKNGAIAGGYQCASGSVCTAADTSSGVASVGEDGLPICHEVEP